MKLMFQSQIISIFISLALVFFNSATAKAQTADEVSQIRKIHESLPWPPCKTFGENLTDDEWQFLRISMRNGFAVGHLPTIDALRVDFVEGTEQLAPTFVPAGIDDKAGTLRIPKRFLQNICNIIRFNFAAQLSNEASRSAAINRLKNCHQNPQKAVSCLLENMSAPEFREPAVDISRNEELFASWMYSYIIRGSTIQTAKYILAHEIGHALIRSTNDRSQLAKIDEELEADLLAQISLVDQEILPFGPLSFLHAQALIEGDGVSKDSLHQPAVCRSIQAGKIFLPMLRRVAALRVSRDSKNREPDFTDSDEYASIFGNLVPLPTPWANIQCDTSTPERVLAVMSDIELDRKSTRLNSSHSTLSRMPSSA